MSVRGPRVKLEDLANGAVVLNASDTLNTAIQHMWRLTIRHLPVLRQGVPIGMVSERDVLLHVCGDEDSTGRLASEGSKRLVGAARIDSVMTSPVVVLSPDDPVEKAARLMLNKRIGAIPIAGGNTVFGIVTETDILKCLTDESRVDSVAGLGAGRVVDHMSAHVFSVGPKDTTLAAIRLMRDQTDTSPTGRGERTAGWHRF